MSAIAVLIGFALAVSVLVVVHELGHLAAAQWCGIKVMKFSIGFGPRIVVWRAGSDQARCTVGLVPLGGFVQLLDERAGPVSAEELPRAGLRKGDVIEAVGARAVRTRGEAWAQILSAIRSRGGVRLTVGADDSAYPVALRAPGEEGRITLPGLGVRFAAARIGRQVIGGRAVGALWVRAAAPVTPKGWTVRIRYRPLEALAGGARMALRLAVLEARAAWNLITLRSSVRDFADARWIAALSGESAGGRGSMLAFLAEISLTLGLVNLLPVPGLDGAQLLFELAQWARGISEEHSEMHVAGRLPGDVECGRAPDDRPPGRLRPPRPPGPRNARAPREGSRCPPRSHRSAGFGSCTARQACADGTRTCSRAPCALRYLIRRDPSRRSAPKAPTRGGAGWSASGLSHSAGLPLRTAALRT